MKQISFHASSVYVSLNHISISLTAAPFYQLRGLPVLDGDLVTVLMWTPHSLSFINEALLDLSVTSSIHTQTLLTSWFSYYFFWWSIISLNVLVTQEPCFKPGTLLVFCATLDTGAYEIFV